MKKGIEKSLKTFQAECGPFKDIDGKNIVYENAEGVIENINKHAKFDLRAMSKGVENELWETMAYIIPSAVTGSDTPLLFNIPHKIALGANDTVHVPTITAGTATITRQGSTPTYSASNFTPGVVDVQTKHQVGIPFNLTRVQKESMSFAIMSDVVAAQKLGLLKGIEKDVMRFMALGLASGNRAEFATGDAWTLAMFQTALINIVTKGAKLGNMFLALDPEFYYKIMAIEDTEGRNMFLDFSIYGDKTAQTGVWGSFIGTKVLQVFDTPGVEDNWSAIEASEVHKCQFMFDARALAVGIEAQPFLFEATQIADGSWDYLLQQFYGCNVIDGDMIYGFKEYEV